MAFGLLAFGISPQARADAKTRAAQKTDIDTLFPSNQPGAITAAKLREGLKTLVDSAYNELDDGTAIDTTALGAFAADPSTNGSFSASAWRTDLSLAAIAASGSASDLSAGTIPDARFPATLPAMSGVNLTALNAANLGSGLVPTARLGSGTASASTFLRGDQTWTAVDSLPSQATNGGKYLTTDGTDASWAALFPAVTASLQVHVNKGGNDATADGTPNKPYLTLTAALAAISDASTTKRYVIAVGPGVYEEATVALKPFVWVVGDTTLGGVRLSLDNPLTVVSTFKDVDGARCGMSNVQLWDFMGFTADLSAQSGSNAALIEFRNVTFDDHVIFTAKAADDYLQMFDCVVWGEVRANGGAVYLTRVDCQIAGGFIGTAPVALSGTAAYCRFTGNCSVTASGAASIAYDFFQCNLYSNLSLTKSSTGNVAVNSDATSLPDVVNITGAATLNIQTYAKRLAYTPTTSAHWPVQPTTAGDALDKLAANKANLVAAPASAGATGTAGQFSYDADFIYVCTATNTWKRAALSTW